FQAEDGIRDDLVTGVQTCDLPISGGREDLKRRSVFGIATVCDKGSKKPPDPAGQDVFTCDNQKQHADHETPEKGSSLVPVAYRQIGRASCRARGYRSRGRGAV